MCSFGESRDSGCDEFLDFKANEGYAVHSRGRRLQDLVLRWQVL